MNKKYGIWILIIALGFFLFVLGGLYGKSLGLSEANAKFNSIVQRYEFETVAVSSEKTNESLNQPFVCILTSDGNTTEKMFENFFIPSLQRQPVCLVNTLQINESEEVLQNETIQ